MEYRVGRLRPPAVQGACLLGDRTDERYELGFAYRSRRASQSQDAPELGLPQEPAEIREADARVGIEPTELDQGRRSLARAADLGVFELAGAEEIALTHDHPDHQRGGGDRKAGEVRHELLLFVREQFPVTAAQPVERYGEVLEVVVRARMRVHGGGVRG